MSILTTYSPAAKPSGSQPTQDHEVPPPEPAVNARLPSAPVQNDRPVSTPTESDLRSGTGKEAKIHAVTVVGKSAALDAQAALPPLTKADTDYLDEREEVVNAGVKASIAAAKALHEIHAYQDGLLWRRDFQSFDHYCHARWGYGKSKSYRLLDTGGFIDELQHSESPNGDREPKNEGQIRPLLATVPKERRVECWNEIVADTDPADLTGKTVKREAVKFVRKNGLAAKPKKRAKTDGRARAMLAVDKLRSALGKLPRPERFDQLLLGIGALVGQDPDAVDGEAPPAVDEGKG